MKLKFNKVAKKPFVSGIDNGVNFIDAFTEVVLTEVLTANKPSKSNSDNSYTIFKTKTNGKVSIMTGKLEKLHEEKGGILCNKSGTVLPHAKVPLKTEILPNPKQKIGRGTDGKLFNVPVA